MLLLTPATSKPANQHTTADPVSFSITKSWNQELVVEGNCLITDMAHIMGEEQSDGDGKGLLPTRSTIKFRTYTNEVNYEAAPFQREFFVLLYTVS